ncbi:Nucleoplasmin core domain-containing protein [Artemisia annua]|uniref:peptidylprolyl isomerase n=1 Tax=Artemisia annua TaxID=35608 RepID=A0A2U1LK44_ARTAN|nr:Nucleoplasmin core domain-containing protein [Artemisia annua]
MIVVLNCIVTPVRIWLWNKLQATLGATKSKEKAIVVCNVGDKKPVYFCSLLSSKLDTCALNVENEEYEEVTFSVEGPHSIHLSGYYFGEKQDSEGDDESYDSFVKRKVAEMRKRKRADEFEKMQRERAEFEETQRTDSIKSEQDRMSSDYEKRYSEAAPNFH